jgi:hypothetical protein
MIHRRIAIVVAFGAVIAALGWTASPLVAQTKGAAESTAAARVDPTWKVPRTAWGHPDLEGTWTSDDMRGVPTSRPDEFGTRAYLTDQEFATRAKQRGTARDVQEGAVGTFRNEEGTRSFGYTSLVIDPADGKVPPMTPAGLARRATRDQGSFGVGPFDKPEDFSLYDRCITRGLVGSFLPVVYGNGARILQTPDAVVINHEMVHDTRIISLDGRPHLGSDIRQYVGDSRGRWEGTTLVVETTNFTDRTSIGANGNGTRHSEAMRMVERFTRVDPEMIDYEVRIDDPITYTKPWTIRMTITRQPGYEIYEYGCHEGNGAVKNALSAERVHERAAAEAAAKGLPPPERVFERVNGPDRGR